jgi:hypothetical protein
MSVQLSVKTTVKFSTLWTRQVSRRNHFTVRLIPYHFVKTLICPLSYSKHWLLYSTGCSIPIADDPDAVVIPKRTPNAIVKKLSFITVDEQDKDSPPLFGGRQNWKQREESFKLNATMKVIGCLYRVCICFLVLQNSTYSMKEYVAFLFVIYRRE